MIRRLVDWLLYSLHIKKRPLRKSGIEALSDMIPIIFAVGFVFSIINFFGKDLPPLTLWQRILRKLRSLFTRFRLVIIGY